MLKLTAIIPRSSNMENRKVGIVILVDRAAKLVTRAIPIAAIANPHNTMLFPVAMMIATVSGVIKHACPAKAIPSHRKRYSSWFLQKLINRVHIEDLLAEGV
jgi:hypothetical protein